MYIRTDEELKTIAKDFCNGLIFTSDHLEKQDLHLLPNIFMPIVFMDTEALKGASLFYEYYDKSYPRGINGFPMFMSMGVMPKEDVDRLNIYIKKYRELEKEFDNV